MARRLYLHIGTMKSGTTYLQALCDANPGALRQLELTWLGSAANFSAVTDFYESAASGQQRRLAWPDFSTTVADADGDVLVSNELLSVRGPRRLGKLVESLGSADVRVVITARDLARTIPSQWQERARNRPTGTWSEFMAVLTTPGTEADPEVAWFWRRQDLDVLVGNAAEIVGMHNVSVVSVPPPGAPSHLLVGRFFAALDRTELPPFDEPHAFNPSLGSRSVELIRRVHQYLDDDERERLRIVLKHVLSRRVLAGQQRAELPIALSADELGWAADRARAMTERLLERGVRVFGDLDDLVPKVSAVTPQPGGSAADAVSDAELLDTAVAALVGMADALDELARAQGGAPYGDVVRKLGQRDLAASPDADELDRDDRLA